MSNKDLIGFSGNPYRAANLTNIMYPSADGGWRDVFRSGWLPGWFNQQWGGAQIGHELIDAATGVLYKFEPLTGNVEEHLNGAVGISGSLYNSIGFKVSENCTPSALWVKIGKIGNPTDNFVFQLYADNGSGAPGSSLAASASVSNRVLSVTGTNQWVRVNLPFSALTAGTLYHIVATRSSAVVDSSNYYTWSHSTNGKYPHGYGLKTSNTLGSWVDNTNQFRCFLIEPSATNKFMQSGGLFDQKLVFTAGSPVNQSKLLCQPVRNFFDGRSGTMLYRGTYVANSVIMDVAYGLDHDRLLVTVNSSGNVVVTLYKKDRTTSSVTSSSTVTTGNHDVAVVYRVAGDGSDYLKLIVDSVTQSGSLSGQTFSVDPLFRELATAWLGGGFAAAPTWTQDMQMTALPSTQGWTWTGTATEANAMSVANGKLYQNKNGYASTDTGYYAKSSAGFNNATGWTVTWKSRTSNSSNNNQIASSTVQVFDGTKYVVVFVHEYFVQTAVSSVDFTVQGDFRSQEHVFTLCGKGSDYYLFIDGKLAIDGTGKLVVASATNAVYFGDNQNNASENADVVWSYMKYYVGGMLLPAANGASLSEFAYWSEAQEAVLGGVYHAVTPISVKKHCGLERNYVGEGVVQREVRRGVINSPSTTSASPVALDAMDAFVIGSVLKSVYCGRINVTGTPPLGGQTCVYVDGESRELTEIYVGASSTNNTQSSVLNLPALLRPIGLHRIDHRFSIHTGGTITSYNRNVEIEARS